MVVMIVERNCIGCKDLKTKGECFYSYVTKQRYKIRQTLNFQSKNVMYLDTCKKCKKQGVGEQLPSSQEWQLRDLASKIKKHLCNIELFTHFNLNEKKAESIISKRNLH